MIIDWTIILTPNFKNELQSIYDYLRNHYENQIAIDQIQKKFIYIESLKQMPNRFSLVKNKKWRKRGLRYMIVSNYIVFFYPNENKNEVIVLHIYYHGRDIPYLLHEKEEI